MATNDADVLGAQSGSTPLRLSLCVSVFKCGRLRIELYIDLVKLVKHEEVVLVERLVTRGSNCGLAAGEPTGNAHLATASLSDGHDCLSVEVRSYSHQLRCFPQSVAST